MWRMVEVDRIGRKGYFSQPLELDGSQSQEPPAFDTSSLLLPSDAGSQTTSNDIILRYG